MKFTAATLRAAYEFLRVVAFDCDPALPHGRLVRFHAKPLKVHGYHDVVKNRHTIWMDTTDTKSWVMALQILAHEMAHLARRDHVFNTDEEAHDTLFQATARMIEQRMGWPKGSV